MAHSLYDLTAPSRRQRERLQGLYGPNAPKKKDETQDPLDESLYGPDRGDPMSGAVHGKSFDQMTNDELNAYAGQGMVGRNAGSAAAGIVGPPGWGLLAGILENSQLNSEFGNRGLANPGDYIDGKVTGGANTSLGISPELMGRNDPMSGADLTGGNAGAWGGTGEKLAKGGKVTRVAGPDPAGPDDGYAALKIGERVINEAQWKGLKPATRAEIVAVFKKTGAKGYERK